jgi:hypothetical protein
MIFTNRFKLFLNSLSKEKLYVYLVRNNIWLESKACKEIELKFWFFIFQLTLHLFFKKIALSHFNQIYFQLQIILTHLFHKLLMKNNFWIMTKNPKS